MRKLSAINIKRSRRVFQYIFLAMIVLFPILDIFRLDMAESRFVILRNYFFINQLYLAIIAIALLLVMLSLFARIFGRLFCGWLCPQTFWSELGGKILSYWSQFKKAKKKDKKIKALLNYILLMLIAFVLSLGFYSMLVSYFVAPKAMYSWLTLGAPIWFYVLFAKFTVVAFIDLLILRHNFCASMCPYGIMQQKAKKSTSMRITFNEDECIDCGMCDRACPMNLKPRELALSNPCINCTECIVACGVKGEKLFAVKGEVKGVKNSLSFGFTPIDKQKKPPIFDKGTLGLAAFSLVFASILLLGVMLDNGIDFTIQLKNEESAAVSATTDAKAVLYEVKTANRKQKEQSFTLEIEAIDEGSSNLLSNDDKKFIVTPTTFTVAPLSKFEETITVKPTIPLSPGRYTILARIIDANGKEVDRTKSVYYVY